MHPYNFEPIFYQKPHFEHIIVRNPKTTDSRTVQHMFNMLDDHGMNKGQYPVKNISHIRTVHTVRVIIPTHAMNKA